MTSWPSHPCRRGVVAAVVLCGAMFSGRLTAQETDFLFVLGAGNVGTWVTEFTVSNRGSEEVTVVVSTAPKEICPPLATCFSSVILPPGGTSTVGSPNAGVAGVYVGYLDRPGWPAVVARARTVSGGAKSIDLPVFRVRSLMELDPHVLVFAGAQRDEGGRSNLILANVADPDRIGDEVVSLRLETLDQDGIVAGERSITLSYGESLFIGDAVGFMGIAELPLGQIRVTKTGGDGTLWGILTILRPDGTSSVSLGLAP